MVFTGDDYKGKTNNWSDYDEESSGYDTTDYTDYNDYTGTNKTTFCVQHLLYQVCLHLE